MDMLEKYDYAPMGGLITGIGLSNVTERGQPCFARLHTEEKTKAYTFNHILKNFAQIPKKTQEIALQNVAQQKRKLVDSAFSNINVFLIYLTRAIQSGMDLSAVLEQKEQDEMVVELKATVQIFYLILLFGTHIYPDYQQLSMLDKSTLSNVLDRLYEHLSFQVLLKKIINEKLDIKAIYENPTADNLMKIVLLLEIPDNAVISPGLYTGIYSYASNRLFTTHASLQEGENDRADPKEIFDLISRNEAQHGINNMLCDYVEGKINPRMFSETPIVLNHIRELEQRVTLLERLFKSIGNTKPISERQRFFLEAEPPFPMVLICEDHQQMKAFNLELQEFRSHKSLKIGKHIRSIATDTEEHRLIIMKFLELHNVYHVKVVLLKQLQESKKTKVAPQSPYLHADGFPRLTWLAAQKMRQEVKIPENQKLNDLLANAQTYNKLSLR
jgi:hypothetical protein